MMIDGLQQELDETGTPPGRGHGDVPRSFSDPRDRVVDGFQGLPAELAEALIESRWADALACNDRLLARASSSARLWFIRGVLLRLASRMDEAIEAHQRSIDLAYAGIGPYKALFQHLEKRGRIDEALACWRLAYERGCATARFDSMALDAWLKRPGATGEELLQAHVAWAEHHSS